MTLTAASASYSSHSLAGSHSLTGSHGLAGSHSLAGSYSQAVAVERSDGRLGFSNQHPEAFRPAQHGYEGFQLPPGANVTKLFTDVSYDFS